MAQLSDAQVAAYARQGGFTGDGLRWAVAVALAESGGRTDATNVNADRYRSTDRGLWQINDHWHPEVSAAQAFDPSSCAAAAYRISAGGTNWREWSTYLNGAAAAELGRATTAANSAGAVDVNLVPPGASGPGADGPKSPTSGALGSLDALGGVASSLAAMGSILYHGAKWASDPSNWLRVALVVGGGGALVAGLVILSDSGVGGPVGSAARGARTAASKATKAVTTTAKVAAVA